MILEAFPAPPAALLRAPWRHRHVLFALARRDVEARYRGSMLGFAWALFQPVLMLAVYSFVFGTVFQARWPDTGIRSPSFSLALFAGLIVFNLFAECVNRAPTLIQGNANYVKKVVFPLEIMPWIALVAALFQAAASLAVWCAFHWLLVGPPPLVLVWLPVVLTPLVLFTLGLSWFVASVAVYLRDTGQVVGVATTALMFISPVFFPLSALPAPYRETLSWNPLARPIEQARDLMMLGRLPDLSDWALSLILGGLIAWLGFAWFQRTRRGFADVL